MPITSLPTAEAIGSLGSLLAIIFLAATALILWQVAILLGTVIANFFHGRQAENTSITGS